MPTQLKTYTFDQKLFRTVWVKATSENEARRIMDGYEQMDGDRHLFITYGEESEDGVADLVSVDGEDL